MIKLRNKKNVQLLWNMRNILLKFKLKVIQYRKRKKYKHKTKDNNAKFVMRKYKIPDSHINANIRFIKIVQKIYFLKIIMSAQFVQVKFEI